PQALGDRRAEAGLMESAVRRVNRVAVRAKEAVRFPEAVAYPRNRPLDAAVRAILVRPTRKDLVHNGAFRRGQLGEKVRETVWEVQDRLGRRVVLDQLRRAFPADLRAAL